MNNHNLTWEDNSLLIKDKYRRVSYNYDLNLFKRKKTFCGIRCLNNWNIIEKYINTNNKLTCLEIGSHEGQSAMYFLKNILKNPLSKLYCVDPFYKSSWSRTDPSVINYEDIFNLNISNNDKNKQINKYIGLNKDFFNTKLFDNIVIDIAYIDDNHTYESTKLNIKYIYPKLRIGGILIFDDYDGNYCDPTDKNAGHHWTDPVKKAVDEFISQYNNKIDVIFKEYQIILRKK